MMWKFDPIYTYTVRVGSNTICLPMCPKHDRRKLSDFLNSRPKESGLNLTILFSFGLKFIYRVGVMGKALLDAGKIPYPLQSST